MVGRYKKKMTMSSIHEKNKIMEINKFDMFKNGYYVFTIEEYDNIQNKYETEIENLKRKLGYERLR